MEPAFGTTSIRGLLERHGLRCTKQREQIYGALAATRSHPTAEDLFAAVRVSEPGMSLATVYNTLEALTEVGLARRLASPSGACRYDADTSNHVHLMMDDGRLVDLPEDLSERLVAGVPQSVLDELARRLGVRVAGVSIQVAAASANGRNAPNQG